MNRFVPYDKMSKKEKKKVNAEKRTVWQMNPITRKTDNRKVYSRKKALRELQEPLNTAECFYLLKVINIL